MEDADYLFGLSPQVYDAVRVLAERKGVSVHEVLVEMLSFGKAAIEARLRGSRLLVETRGHVREIVLS